MWPKSPNPILNAENRLTSVEKSTPVVGDKKVEFSYDYMGRRVQKVVSAWNGSEYVESTEKLFIYDGWNLVEEITVVGATETSKYYVWGLDLFQSLQGAGGVGGLLAVVDGSETYHVNYDGNGNVSQLVDSSDGSIVAHYEYDPFGNLNYSSGNYADNNPFRFSTKYHDEETSLIYYGYRYYSAEMGRWISRDPIEEEGGINLYAFVQNNTINYVDINGLSKFGGMAWFEYYFNKSFPNPDAVFKDFTDVVVDTSAAAGCTALCLCGVGESDLQKAKNAVRGLAGGTGILISGKVLGWEVPVKQLQSFAKRAGQTGLKKLGAGATGVGVALWVYDIGRCSIKCTILL